MRTLWIDYFTILCKMNLLLIYSLHRTLLQNTCRSSRTCRTWWTCIAGGTCSNCNHTIVSHVSALISQSITLFAQENIIVKIQSLLEQEEENEEQETMVLDLTWHGKPHGEVLMTMRLAGWGMWQWKHSQNNMQCH